MRTGIIGINGKKHILCFSVRVVRHCTERYGSMSGLYDALSSEDELYALDESLWLLSEMMKAGEKYAQTHGLETAPSMTPDELEDACDVSDFRQITASIILTINNGKKTNVEVENSPNAEATQGS